jgi:hypothetical protein
MALPDFRRRDDKDCQEKQYFDNLQGSPDWLAIDSKWKPNRRSTTLGSPPVAGKGIIGLERMPTICEQNEKGADGIA